VEYFEMGRLIRLRDAYGRGGVVPVGRTKFFDDFVLNSEADPFVPNSEIPRLKLIPLGERAMALDLDEVNSFVDQLKQLRQERRQGTAAERERMAEARVKGKEKKAAMKQSATKGGRS
jgi:hypothetical protein